MKLKDVNTSISSECHGLSQSMAIERHGWRGRRRSMTVDDNTSCRHTTGHRRHMIADDAKRHVETLSKENILRDGDKAQLPSRRHSMRQAHRQTYENALLDKGEAAGLIVATSRRADVIKTHGIKQSQSLESSVIRQSTLHLFCLFNRTRIPL